MAIGECGLDFYRIPDDEMVLRSFALSHESANEPRAVAAAIQQLQERTFRQQIALAQELNLPLMVHVRDEVPTPSRSPSQGEGEKESVHGCGS